MERIENWAGMGFPDVFVNAGGSFHLIELKVSHHNAVSLRPHQVAFHTKHSNGSIWILVKQLDKSRPRHAKLFVYHGRQAVDVANKGLKTDPICSIDTGDDWDKIFKTIELGEEHVFHS